MKIYLVRHGSTEWNSAGRIMGSKNIPLSEEGIRQARQLSKVLPVSEIPEVYSSPLDRAYRTAEIISSGEVEVRDEFRERSFGEWEGMSWKELYRERPDLPPEGDSKWLNLRPPEGETNLEMRERCLEGLQELLGREFVLVSHSGPLRFIAAELLDIEPEAALKDIAFNTASYLVLESWGQHWDVAASEGVEGLES